MTLKIFKNVVRLAGMQNRDQSTIVRQKKQNKSRTTFIPNECRAVPVPKILAFNGNVENPHTFGQQNVRTSLGDRRCHNSGHYLVPACLNSFCLTILMNWIYFDFQILTLSWLLLFQVGTTVCQNWPYEWSTTTNKWQWLCQLLTSLELIWLSGYLFV